MHAAVLVLMHTLHHASCICGPRSSTCWAALAVSDTNPGHRQTQAPPDAPAWGRPRRLQGGHVMNAGGARRECQLAHRLPVPELGQLCSQHQHQRESAQPAVVRREPPAALRREHRRQRRPRRGGQAETCSNIYQHRAVPASTLARAPPSTDVRPSAPDHAAFSNSLRHAAYKTVWLQPSLSPRLLQDQRKTDACCMAHCLARGPLCRCSTGACCIAGQTVRAKGVPVHSKGSMECARLLRRTAALPASCRNRLSPVYRPCSRRSRASLP